MKGGRGKDTYVFRAEDGDDVIDERASYLEDYRLFFDEGISVEDIYAVYAQSAGEHGAHDLMIGLKANAGTITILGEGKDKTLAGMLQMQEFVFSDGTLLTRNQFREATLGTDGHGYFDGSARDDDFFFNGRAGDDTLRESFAATGQYADNDRLVFGAGITADDLYSFSAHVGGDSNDHDFTIGLKNGDGTITILDDGEDHIYGDRHNLTMFVFSDTTTLTRNEFRVATLGTDGDYHFDGSTPF